MKHLALALLTTVASCASAYAQDITSHPTTHPDNCTLEHNKDVLTVEAEGPGLVVVTYLNSSAQCSMSQDFTVTASNGIEVRIIILVNSGDEATEKLIVIPTSSQYQAFPPESLVKDGEEMVVVVQGGLS